MENQKSSIERRAMADSRLNGLYTRCVLLVKRQPRYFRLNFSSASASVMPYSPARPAMPSLKQDSSSSSVMPQMALYSGRREMSTKLFSASKTGSEANFVMPVMRTKRRYGARVFSGA